MNETPEQFHVICSWCGVIKGTFAGDGDSHGICESCMEKMLAQAGITRKQLKEVINNNGNTI